MSEQASTASAEVLTTITLDRPDGRRAGEPIRLGVPFARGSLREADELSLQDPQGRPVPLQAEALTRWSDGSVRWALLDFFLVGDGGDYALTLGGQRPAPERGLELDYDGEVLRIDTGAMQLTLKDGDPLGLGAVDVAGRRMLEPRGTALVVDGSTVPIESFEVVRGGSLRVEVVIRGVARAGAPDASVWSVGLHAAAGSSTVRMDVTARNNSADAHPGGRWSVGDPGLIELRDPTLLLHPGASDHASVRLSREADRALEDVPPSVEIVQDSSGGERWDSPNHIRGDGTIPCSFRGYAVRGEGLDETGTRADPIVQWRAGDAAVAVHVQRFWQNFPKSIEATEAGLAVRLFPEQKGRPQELLGGEQKTHTLHIALGPDAGGDAPLAWAREPSRARLDAAYVAATKAVRYLRPADPEPGAHERIVRSAIEGDDTFFHKREAIDEFGWRHFGDVYGDHEAVFHRGDRPLISHYNNQYDNVAGFVEQWLRTGDERWRDLADDLARHVADVDIYHTDADKSAYNHGMFWHTVHYVDADLSGHRTYPPLPGVAGGGPSGGHIYARGLMLHHLTTGEALSREAVEELAGYVLAADDGRRTIFRFLDRGPTGHMVASATGYHGPGRAPANSVRTLLDAWELTGERRYLDKAEELIRRVIHPGDDPDAMGLDDPETRWFYTMFLQVLGRYLDVKIERDELDETYAYAQASLLRYADWMAERERPWLDRPEKLEYPTETWAAQDIRKADCFAFAAMHADDDARRERFLERCEFFLRYSGETLETMPTRTLARPVAVVMTSGWVAEWLVRHRDARAPAARSGRTDFGQPRPFVPQRDRAIRRAKGLLGVGAVVATGAMLAGLAWLAGWW